MWDMPIFDVSLSSVSLLAGLLLILTGLWGMLSRKNLLRIIIGFSLLDTGIHLVMVSVGYLSGRTAPIIDEVVHPAAAAQAVVDPIPSALVLTAIVIGLGVTAVMLSYAVRIYKLKKSLSIDDCSESKW